MKKNFYDWPYKTLFVFLFAGNVLIDADESKLSACEYFEASYQKKPNQFVSNTTLVQADGKIISAGYEINRGKTTFSLERRLADGSLDSSFGVQGKVCTSFGAGENNSNAYAVVLQQNGMLIAAGFTDVIKGKPHACLARYHADGSLDENFFGGRAIVPGTFIIKSSGLYSEISALALTSDNEILAAGTHYYSDRSTGFMQKFTQDGLIDQNFGNQTALGQNSVSISFGSEQSYDRITAMTVQYDGKIIVAGNSSVSGVPQAALARYTPQGLPDSSFSCNEYTNADGTVIARFGSDETASGYNSVLCTAQGKIVAGGFTNAGCAFKNQKKGIIAQYTSRGQLDRSFGIDGVVLNEQERANEIYSVALIPEGIMAAGINSNYSESSYYLQELSQDGQLHAMYRSKLKFDEKNNDPCCCLCVSQDGALFLTERCTNNKYSRIEKMLRAQKNSIKPVIFFPDMQKTLFNGKGIEARGICPLPCFLEIFCDEVSIASCVALDEWKMPLPSLSDGHHTLRVKAYYPAARAESVSDELIFTVDQTPHAMSAHHDVYSVAPFIGKLQAQHASGDYDFSILSATNGTVELQGDTYTFVPSIDQGSASFVYQVKDKISEITSCQAITFEINRSLNQIQKHIKTYTEKAVQGDCADLVEYGKKPFSYRLINGPSHGTVSLTDGQYKFISDKNFVGSTSFYCQIQDDAGAQVISEVTVEVLPLPSLADSIDCYANTVTKIDLASLTKYAQSPCSYHIIKQPEHARITVQDTTMSVFTDEWSGEDVFILTISDAAGVESKQLSVALKIYSRPTLSYKPLILQENKIYSAEHSLQAAGGVGEHTYELVNVPLHCAVGLAPEGHFTIVPDKDYNGPAQFECIAKDGNGMSSASITVPLTIQPQARIVPLITIDVNRNRVNQGSLANAIKAGLAPFQFFAVGENPGFSLLLDGSYTIAIPKDIHTSIEYKYVIADVQGKVSNEGVLQVIIHDKPVAYDRSLMTLQNQPIILPQDCMVVTPPYHGCLQNQNGSLWYRPAQDFFGFDQIEFCVQDQYGISNVATLKLEVKSVPICKPSSFTIGQNEILLGCLASYVTGGQKPYTFLADDTMKANVMKFNKDGTFLYQPSHDFVGSESIKFTVIDALGIASENACTVITVNPIDVGIQQIYKAN